MHFAIIIWWLNFLLDKELVSSFSVEFVLIYLFNCAKHQDLDSILQDKFLWK